MTGLRIALLGVAHVHAPGYAAWLNKQPDVEFIGFSEDNPAYAQEFTFAPHHSLTELLALKPHGVIICSENVKHRALTEAAAQAGAHVLGEKPMATTLEDAQAMRETCEQAGVSLHIAYPVRYSPAVQQLRQQLDRGDLGELLAYSGINHSICPDRDRAWFSNPALAGGGAGMDHIVHIADLLWHFGERVESVYAQLKAVPELVLPEHADVDAVGLVTLRLQSGATASIDCSWSRPRTYPRWGHLKLDVIGTQGMQSLDTFAENIQVTNTRGHRWEDFGSDLNGKMLRDFVNVCAGQPAQLLADAQAGEDTLKIVLAAYESTQSDKPVSLN